MKKITGLLAAGLLASGGAAFAGGDKMHEDKKAQQTQTESPQYGTQPALGGSAQAGAQTEQEVSGQVVKAKGDTVYLDHMGAVLPVELNKQTKFQGQGLTKKQDLKKGQQIRAKIMVQDETKNVASSIELQAAGMGGSGDFPATTPSDTPDQATEPTQGTGAGETGATGGSGDLGTQPQDPGMSGTPGTGTGGSGSVGGTSDAESDTATGTGGASEPGAIEPTEEKAPESGTQTPEE